MVRKPEGVPRTQTSRQTSRRDFLAGLSASVSLAAAGVPRFAFAAAQRPAQRAAAGEPIARCAIYPSIGFARVGNSREWFLGPEVPGLYSEPVGGYKDAEGLVKRQGARFRVYGLTEDGRVVREVNTRDDRVEWAVQVANTKPCWYGFNNPLDMGEDAPGLPGQLRNDNIKPDDRARMLIIDGGARWIVGPGVNPSGDDPGYRMTGRFWDTLDVPLGDLSTDERGRLIFLGGSGLSQSAVPDNGITSFSDNDGWHDDWSDGSVQARVFLADGSEHRTEPAWAVCAGPNFAPEIPAVVTLYDMMRDLFWREQWLALDGEISFLADIYPIFHRLGLMEWITQEAFLRQGWLDVGDFLDPAYIARLADSSPANRRFRASVFEKFRRPDTEEIERLKLPYMLGGGINYSYSPRRFLTVTQLQFGLLEEWVAGNYDNDWGGRYAASVETVEDLPLDQQPEALTRAALEPCSGGGFHPGVEVTWPLRHIAMYNRETQEPFRLALSSRPTLEQNVGKLLTPQLAFAEHPVLGAPVGPVAPGDLTRWMGLPWQGDAFSCQSVLFDADSPVYETRPVVKSDEFPTPVWWPALLPIDVLPEEFYDRLMDTSRPPEERLRFYNQRVSWSRGVAGVGYHADASYIDGLSRMVYLWFRMGFVVKRPGPTDPALAGKVPPEIFVETDRGTLDLGTGNANR